MKLTLVLVGLIVVGAVEAGNIVITKELNSFNFTNYSETLEYDVIDIILSEQNSSSACTFGDSFGYEGKVVWVDNGCCGQFIVILDNSTYEGTCFLENFNHEGADLRMVRNVTSAEICLDLCVEKNGCSSISYEASSLNCWLKNQQYGESPEQKTGVTSANIACLARLLQADADCIETDYDYQGADIMRVTSITSIEDCVVECEQEEGCLSVTFQVATSKCWLKYLERGANPESKDGVDSVTVACLDSVETVISGGRDSCLEDDIGYQGTDIRNVSNILTVEECAALCRVEEECESVSHRSDTRDCWLKSGRNGANTEYVVGIHSVNLLCVSLARQGSDSCIREDYDFRGADIKRITNVANLTDCLAECVNTDLCVSVTHQPSSLKCWLKSKRSGDEPQDMEGVNSQNLFCGAGSSSSCIMKDFDYEGADISKSKDVESVEECVTLGQDVDECVSITYQASTKKCWFKSKKNGDLPAPKTGVDSVNLYCLDGGPYY